MPAFSVTFSIVDPRSRRGVFFKQDGKRFGSERTVKFCTDVRYDIRVAVKPSIAPLRNLIIGGDDLSPDSSEEKDGQFIYKFTWFTNGYTPTQSSRRHDVRFSFLFDGAEFATSFQTKFYAVPVATTSPGVQRSNRSNSKAEGNLGVEPVALTPSHPLTSPSSS